MDTISDFKLLDNLYGYNKAANPNMLSVFDLLPHGITWRCNGKVNEIKHNDKIIPLLLRNNDGIALIKSPFNKKYSQAYIVSPINEVIWDVGIIARKKFGNVVFFDVYYVHNELCFFVNVDGRDYRFVFELGTGGIGSLTPSY